MIVLSTPIVARIAAPSESNDAAIDQSIRTSSLANSATCISTMLAQGQPCRCPPPQITPGLLAPRRGHVRTLAANPMLAVPELAVR
jgi:hypothetical protein